MPDAHASAAVTNLTATTHCAGRGHARSGRRNDDQCHSMPRIVGASFGSYSDGSVPNGCSTVQTVSHSSHSYRRVPEAWMMVVSIRPYGPQHGLSCGRRTNRLHTAACRDCCRTRDSPLLRDTPRDKPQQSAPKWPPWALQEQRNSLPIALARPCISVGEFGNSPCRIVDPSLLPW